MEIGGINIEDCEMYTLFFLGGEVTKFWGWRLSPEKGTPGNPVGPHLKRACDQWTAVTRLQTQYIVPNVNVPQFVSQR